MMNNAINRQRKSRNSQRRLAAMVSREMANVIPQAIQQFQATQAPIQAPVAVATNGGAHLKNFSSCTPPKFTGKDGATSLLQWLEKIESVFSVADIPINLHVKYAASTFSGRALTWWNQEKVTRGMETAHEMLWSDFKEILTEEFCPENEMNKLNEEFWHLAQIGGNNSEYTTRFHELSLLIPRLVTPLKDGINKYIKGLPPRIRDSVRGSKPTSIEEAVRLAAQMTDDHVNDGALTRTGSGKKTSDKGKEVKVDGKTEPSKTDKPTEKKRKVEKSKAFVITEPNKLAVATAPNKKVYGGPFPLCANCNYHHPVGQPCRMCTRCNKFGHFAQTCRVGQNVAIPMTINTFAPPAPPVQAQAFRFGCFGCGDPNHFIRDCPLRHGIPPAPQNIQQPAGNARVYNINHNQAPANQEAPNA